MLKIKRTQDSNEMDSHLAPLMLDFCGIRLAVSSANGNNYPYQMKVYLKIRGSGLT
jgi:hypothetical protein